MLKVPKKSLVQCKTKFTKNCSKTNMRLLLSNLLTDALCCCLKISIDIHVVSIGITVNACLHVHAQVTFVVIHCPFFSIVQICNLTIAHVNCCCNLKQFLAIFTTRYYSGRRSGLMVSALDSGLNGPGLSPGWGALRCVLGQYTLLL